MIESINNDLSDDRKRLKQLSMMIYSSSEEGEIDSSEDDDAERVNTELAKEDEIENVEVSRWESPSPHDLMETDGT